MVKVPMTMQIRLKPEVGGILWNVALEFVMERDVWVASAVYDIGLVSAAQEGRTIDEAVRKLAVVLMRSYQQPGRSLSIG